SVLVLLGVLGVVHLCLTAVITLLLLGRTKRGLLEGRIYPLETAGYWWLYVAGLTIVAWLLVTFF
ncbi:MAG: hypothetical protein ACYDBS_08310, partial [Acidimicrobiales bacterium]